MNNYIELGVDIQNTIRTLFCLYTRFIPGFISLRDMLYSCLNIRVLVWYLDYLDGFVCCKNPDWLQQRH